VQLKKENVLDDWEKKKTKRVKKGTKGGEGGQWVSIFSEKKRPLSSGEERDRQGENQKEIFLNIVQFSQGKFAISNGQKRKEGWSHNKKTE